MSEEKTEQKKPSIEEIEKRFQQMEEYYKKQIPFLKMQLEYEDLVTLIQESRTRRAMAMMREAQIMIGSSSEDRENNKKPDMIQPEEGVPKESVIRKLKPTI